MSFQTQLENEIAALEADLIRDARYARLCKLRELLSLYETRSISQVNGSEKKGRDTKAQREAALASAKVFLEGRTEPTKIGLILNHLVSNGIQIGGANASSNLSALLSKTEGFESNGKMGWTLSKPAATN